MIVSIRGCCASETLLPNGRKANAIVEFLHHALTCAARTTDLGKRHLSCPYMVAAKIGAMKLMLRLLNREERWF
ncbi:MAG TPA: hypothetical protein VJ783_30460 [Pirellulales bacterium]|nr:hypothetical protein [Pirellulales bacterium]